jgi:hypothetical protein
MCTLPLPSAAKEGGTVQPKGKVLRKEEREVAEAVILLQKQRNPKSLAEKVVIEKRLKAMSENTRALANARLREEQPAQRPKAPGLKWKAGAEAKWKTKDQVEANRAKHATADTKAVVTFMREVQDALNDCALGRDEDAKGALRKAAKVEVTVPTSCKDTTQTALEAVLASIAEAVEGVFEAGASLVIPRSQEEIEAEELAEDFESRSRRYGNKILSHNQELDRSKTVFGREYERSRMRHYKQKMDALPTREDVAKGLEAAGRLRKEQIAAEIGQLLDDMKKKVDRAIAAAGGRDALPEGTDGGVAAMTRMIQAYSQELNAEAETRS